MRSQLKLYTNDHGGRLCGKTYAVTYCYNKKDVVYESPFSDGVGLK